MKSAYKFFSVTRGDYLKRVVAYFVSLLILLIPVTAFAQTAPQVSSPEQTEQSQPDSNQQAQTQVVPFDDSKVTASTVLLFNAETGQEIYSKNPDGRLFPASTTKLMTALLAEESGKFDEKDRSINKIKITDGMTQLPSGSSMMGLKSGESIPVRDLMYGMMLVSGNDAAVAVADYLAGSVDAFAAQMNTKAQQLGMTGSHFINPNGVQDDNHYTTGADMKKLAMAVFQSSDLMGICGTKTYSVSPTNVTTETRTLKNTNKLIYTDPKTSSDSQYYYEFANGMKTGSTPTAHGCVVASAKKGDLSLIALVFGDTSDQGANRWLTAKDLFDYGFKYYQNVSASDFMSNYSVNETISNPAKNDPEQGVLKLTAQPDQGQKNVMMNIDQAAAIKAGTADVKAAVTLTRPLTAPANQGDVFGRVDFTLNGTSIGTAKLVASRQVFTVGEEQAQSEALGQSPFEYWAQSNLDLEKNPAVLWWLLVPGIVIALLLFRTINVNRRKSFSASRLPASRYYQSRPMHKRPRYRGRYK
jgi:serine-type D-Ala-D-Ala carboxypeptidase (penicillin-binding protein 5/6)